MDNWDTKQLGGIGFLIGNGALFINGLLAHMHGDTPEVRHAGMSRMTSSMAWNAGAIVLARYGNVPVEKQFDRLQEKLAAHLQHGGVPLNSETLRKADAETRRGWFGKFEDFMYQHPIECANICNTMAATGMLASGLLRRKRGEIKSSNANLFTSALLLGGSLILMFTPERTPEQIHENGHDGTLWGAMQKRPLAFAMPPFLAADLSFAAQAWGEHHTAKQLPTNSKLKPYASLMSWLSVGVMACFFGGDVMTGISSKKMHGTPEDHQANQEKMVEAAAQMLSAVPPDQLQFMAKSAAEYMSKQQWLRMVELKPEILEGQIIAAVVKHRQKPLSTTKSTFAEGLTQSTENMAPAVGV